MADQVGFSSVSRKDFKSSQGSSLGGQFLRLPHVVLNSTAYRDLSHTERSLLLDIALQFGGKNNGALVACRKYLAPLGWTSNDTVGRALKGLIASGLLIETRKGAKPNRAAWFALTWIDLQIKAGLDIDPRHYMRGSFVDKKINFYAPSHGVGSTRIVPSHGGHKVPLTPSNGSIQ
jgi:hypothetical protein